MKNKQEINGVPSLWRRAKKAAPTALVFLRFAFPLFTGLLMLVMGGLYTVQGVILGDRYEVSILRLIGNTFTGTHNYLGGERKEAGDRLYSALSIGAIVCVLAFLAAIFLAALALYTTVQSYRMRQSLKESNRMRMIFKVAYPNRVCLFLSFLLYFPPVLFPHYYAALSAQYALLSGTSVFYVLLNRPLITLGVCTVLYLILSLLSPRYERRRGLDMFTLREPVQEQPDEDEVQEE